MGDRLQEVHVSGINKDQRHCMLIESDNKEIFKRIVKKLYNKNNEIPIILEGKIPENKPEIIRNEINFIREIIK